MNAMENLLFDALRRKFEGDIAAALTKVGVNYVGASGTHTFDVAGDVLGTGYEVCQFSGADFSCPQVWTADGGLSAK